MSQWNQPPGGQGSPPQGGGYPPQGGGYPPQGGGYPPQGGGYPPQGGGYPPQGGQPPQQGGPPRAPQPSKKGGGLWIGLGVVSMLIALVATGVIAALPSITDGRASMDEVAPAFGGSCCCGLVGLALVVLGLISGRKK